VLDATTDAEQFPRWWTRKPHCNIGLSSSGLLAIGIDPAGLSWPGDEGKRQSIKGTGSPLQRTPRGGFHLLFGVPAGHHWRCSVGLLAPGVDTRTAAGYVLTAPSVVRARSYRWICPIVPKAELPLPAHRGRDVQAYLRQQASWLSVEYLPPYAPELNPMEYFAPLRRNL